MDSNELFYEIPYVKEFDAVVTGCIEGKKGFEITLSKSAFYPEGGGQLADGGTIGDANVSDTRRVNGAIVHYADKPLTVGANVHCVIDWQKRFDHMQAHSGEHIVSGLIHKHFGFDNVGFHMAPDKVTVDFNGVVTDEQLEEIEREANEYIYSNVPVSVAFPSPDELAELEYRSKKELSGEVRIVTFPGADICACCGTHVIRSGEVGLIKFISSVHYKSGIRVEMLCGRLALEDYIKKNFQERELCHIFSAKPYEVVEAVKASIAESEEKDRRAAELVTKYLSLRAQSFPEGGRLIIDFEEGLKPIEVRKFCDSLAASKKARVAAVFTETEKDGKKGWNYVLCSREEDMRAASKELNKALNGRGGGDPTLVQGSFFATREEIEKALTEKFA